MNLFSGCCRGYRHPSQGPSLQTSPPAIADDCGIYAIVNHVTGRFYLGSSLHLMRRRMEHRNALERGVHHNVRLQADWALHGPSAFDFDIVCTLAADQRLAVERRLLSRLVGQPSCYNEARRATIGFSGRKHSPDTLALLSTMRRGKKQSPETIEKRAAHHRGRKRTGEALERIRQGVKTRPLPSAETRAKLSASLQRRWKRSEFKDRHPRKGSRHSEESRRKIGEKHRAIAAAKREAHPRASGPIGQH